MPHTAEWKGQQIELDEIEIGAEYRFTCTSVQDAALTPRSGDTVTVLSALPVESESEPLYRVRFADGHEGDAYAGELNGWYLKTGQAYAEPECEHGHTRPDPDSDEWLCDDCGQRIFSP